MHILASNFIPKIVKMKMEDEKEYYRKLDHSRQNKLKYQTHSASIGNFRQQEEARSHLPLTFMNQEK